MKSEFVCMAKPNVDYTKYGFRKEKNNEYTFWLLMEINKKILKKFRNILK